MANTENKNIFQTVQDIIEGTEEYDGNDWYECAMYDDLLERMYGVD